MRSNLKVYLMYLAQAAAAGLPPDGRRWDHPCPRFRPAADELLRRGWARRRWIFWGPLGITPAGCSALVGGRCP